MSRKTSIPRYDRPVIVEDAHRVSSGGDHRFDRYDHSGAQPQSPALGTVVRDFGILVEVPSDAVTDVLSFPMLDYEPGEVPAERVQRALEEQETDPETGEVVLGDIVICLKRAMEQAEAYGHSLKREMAFLAVHSVLHLLGYDHMVKEEETVMFARQEAILEAAGLPR